MRFDKPRHDRAAAGVDPRGIVRHHGRTGRGARVFDPPITNDHRGLRQCGAPVPSINCPFSMIVVPTAVFMTFDFQNADGGERVA